MGEPAAEAMMRWFPQVELQLGEGEESKAHSVPVEASGTSNTLPPRAPPLITSPTPLPSSCALSPPAEGPVPAPSDDVSASDPSSRENRRLPWPVMCTPKTAKELSEVTRSYYAVKDLDHPEDLIPEDVAAVPGIDLQGYLAGRPVYYSNTGIQAKLKAIETLTAVGIRYVPQPIESCFEPTIRKNSAGASDGDSSGCGPGDSGYGSSSLHDEPARVPPPNRTFANEWIAVRRSPLGGYGIFATRDIPRNTHFLLERPFIHISGYSELATKYDELGEEEKLVYDGLHGFDRTSDDPVKKRWNANSFFLHHREAVLAIASNFNHACHARRNAQYRWDDHRRVMTFTATEGPVARGEELLISYGEFRDALFEKFGFVCRCGGCEGEPWEVVSSQLDF